MERTMKLCAIIMVWDDFEMVNQCVEFIRGHVEGVIFVWSEFSNFGEKGQRFQVESTDKYIQYVAVNREPQFSHPMNSETDKRNVGLQKARELGYTHFIMMDSDEFYNPIDFAREKKRFIDNPELAGLVCATQVYFKKPTLTIGLDTTLVPFIHKITPTLRHEFNKSFPFAWEGHKIRIDPTRALNINSGVEWSEIVMHHYSWVRKDYDKKIRNSTARGNIEKSTIKEDLLLAKDGYFCKFYGKVLHSVPNYFNIPDYDVMVQNF